MSVESDPLVARTGERGPWHVMALRTSTWRITAASHESLCGALRRWSMNHASSVGVEERRCKAAGCAAAWAKIDAGKVTR